MAPPGLRHASALKACVGEPGKRERRERRRAAESLQPRDFLLSQSDLKLLSCVYSRRAIMKSLKILKSSSMQDVQYAVTGRVQGVILIRLSLNDPPLILS